MFKFGKTSRANLITVHPLLQLLFNEVIKRYDCSILCGRRPKEAQDKAFAEGKSKVEWPNSRHNVEPPGLSDAVDVAPYPIDWDDLKRFYHFGGYVKATAELLDIKIRWGGDWDGDLNFKDQNFHDLPHFELIE